MTRNRLLLVTLFATLAVAATTRADVIPEGYKSVSNEQVLAFVNSVRDRVETSYVIREGDTLSAIAKRELGEAKRFEEILALNPGLEAAKLKIGQRIVLPPKVVNPDKPFPYVFLAWTGGTPGPEPQIVRPGDPIPRARYGLEILAITPEQLAKLRSEKDPTRFDPEKIRSLEPKISTGRMYATRNVPDSDPTTHVKIEDTIHGVQDGKVLLVQKNTFLNSKGNVVRVLVDVNDPSLEDAKKDEEDNSFLPLIPIVFTGGLGLIWLATRRRRTAPPVPATTLA